MSPPAYTEILRVAERQSQEAEQQCAASLGFAPCQPLCGSDLGPGPAPISAEEPSRGPARPVINTRTGTFPAGRGTGGCCSSGAGVVWNSREAGDPHRTVCPTAPPGEHSGTFLPRE